METEKNHDRIVHSEGVLDDNSSKDALGIDRVIGRDFTVSESDLPKGYVSNIF
jgi:hypothetical protein